MDNKKMKTDLQLKQKGLVVEKEVQRTGRLNMQIAIARSDIRVYINRTLNHNLQQPAQETNLLFTITNTESQPALSQTCRKSGCYV